LIPNVTTLLDVPYERANNHEPPLDSLLSEELLDTLQDGILGRICRDSGKE
jgi:hypothetical protein